MKRPMSWFIKGLLGSVVGFSLLVLLAAGAVLIEDGYIMTLHAGDKASNRMSDLSQAIWNDVNNPEITVRAVRGTIILEGLTESEERERAEILAQAYVDGYVSLLPRKTKLVNLIVSRVRVQKQANIK